MANLFDNTAIDRVIAYWKKEAEPYEEALLKIDEKSQKLKTYADNIITKFKKSTYVSYKVTPDVLMEVTNGNLLTALKKLHIASYRTQEVSARFKTKYNPQMIEQINYSNNLNNEIYTRFTTDNSINSLLKTNAAIERYYNSITIKIAEHTNNIAMCKKFIDELSKFVEEQLFALSRLDGVIKYNNSLQIAETMNTANSGVTMKELRRNRKENNGSI